MSLYFKQKREQYYNFLEKVRTKGDWQGWLRFFLTGVNDTAQHAVATMKNIQLLCERDRKKIHNLNLRSTTVLEIHQMLQREPVTTVPLAASNLNKSAPTTRKAIENLEEIGILKEITGKKRDRAYVYDRYIKILSEWTEPLRQG